VVCARACVHVSKMLTLVVGLCCAGFINPVHVVAGVWRQSSSMILNKRQDSGLGPEL
jgi:hypothetical protein